MGPQAGSVVGEGRASGPVRADRRSRALRFTALAAIPAYLLLSSALPGRAGDVVGAAALLVAAIVAAIAAWDRYRFVAHLRIWAYLSASCVAWAAGQAVWVTTVAVVDDPQRVPSWADVGFLAALPFAILATAQLPFRTTRRAVVVLDGVLASLSLFVVGWAVWLGPEYRSGTWLALVFPIADVAIITATVTALGQAAGSTPRRDPSIVAGVAAITAADLAFAFLTVTDRYDAGSTIELGWLVGFLLLASAAAATAPPAAPAGDEVGEVDVFAWSALVLPYASIAAAALTYFIVQMDRGELEPTLVYPGVALLATLVVRQVLTQIESERRAEALSRQATFDSLTGLWNRDTLRRHIDRLLGQRGAVGVLFIDVDDFRDVNETLGPAAGDALLVEVAQRLRRCIRRDDRAARLGSDEFAVVIGEFTQPSGAVLVASRIVEEMAEPFLAGESTRSITASIGIAVADVGVDSDTLLRNADFAKDAAKQKGKNRYELYEPDLHADAVQRIVLTLQLERAIERDEFVLHYQPSYDLDTGRITGAEALIRWNHPARGLVRPAEFVAVAEASTHIHAIGRWVLREACQVAARLREAGVVDDDFHISVNVSPRQLFDGSFLDAIDDALAAAPIPPDSLVLELTESSLIDTEAALPVLTAVRAKGVRLAIDDFGTGYSSLSYLDRLPLDIVKIDRSFVAEVDRGVEKQAMAKAIVVLATSLGLGTVAEGIERPSQADELRRLGCTQAQGYLFSEPVPEQELVDRLVEAGGNALAC